MDVRKRILIVDDDEQVLFVMRNTLRKLADACEVMTASSGREALEIVKENDFALILTDLRMADMDGIELTERIAKLCPETVVLWMTAYGCHNVRDDVDRLEVHRCVDKPMEIGEIRQVVRDALASTERTENVEMGRISYGYAD